MQDYIFELDDFQTRNHIVWELFRLKGQCPGLRVNLFALIGLSDYRVLKELSERDWIEVAAHGWDHFSEWKWNYWEARHFFEQAETMGILKPIFKMPWNRWPSLGFIKAIRESGWAFATSRDKRYQAWFLKILGIPSYISLSNTIWCHPQDLFQLDLSDFQDFNFRFVTDYL